MTPGSCDDQALSDSTTAKQFEANMIKSQLRTQTKYVRPSRPSRSSSFGDTITATPSHSSLNDRHRVAHRSSERHHSNQTRPARLPHSTASSASFALALTVACCCVRLMQCHQAAATVVDVSSNEIERQRGVTNLKLVPDFRAVKLHWTYEHRLNLSSEIPSAFNIRYCELTSWNIEIKCRERELKVLDASKQQQHHHHQHANRWQNNTRDVRTAQPDNSLINLANVREAVKSSASSSVDDSLVVFKLGDTHDNSSDNNVAANKQTIVASNYEAFIYDLRALTTYTFKVRVARFASDHNDNKSDATMIAHNHEHAKRARDAKSVSATGSDNHLQPQQATQTTNLQRRQLRVGSPHSDSVQQSAAVTKAQSDTGAPSLDVASIETRAFGAEPSKCSANFSDVLVHTGRYFGGRISVEMVQAGGKGPATSACQLAGNKTSDKSVYLFRIDHALCGSKIIDDNRIETMILVHENKDILTHNTARFLVLCNIQHNSFMLRASVSLPRVNGQLVPGGQAGSGQQQQESRRAAVITPLASKPNSNHLMLGSMPVVYRPRNPSATTDTPASSPADRSQRSRAPAMAPVSGPDLVGAESSAVASPVKVPTAAEAPAASEQKNNNGNRQPPSPVSVQSRTLTFAPSDDSGFISEFGPSLSARAAVNSGSGLEPNGNSKRRSDSYLRMHRLEVLAAAERSNAIGQPLKPQDILASASMDREPIITVTNNHRVVANNAAPLSSWHTESTATPVVGNQHNSNGRPRSRSSVSAAPAPSNVDNSEQSNYTIRYSTANVDEYAVGRAPVDLSSSSDDYATTLSTTTPPQSTTRVHRSTTAATTIGRVAVATRSGRMHQWSGQTTTGDADEPARSKNDSSSSSSSSSSNKFQHRTSQLLHSSSLSSKAAEHKELPAKETVDLSIDDELVGLNGNQSATTTSSLAQNITGYLLKLSLKALTNFARKSLESMTAGTGVDLAASGEPVTGEPHLNSDELRDRNNVIVDRANDLKNRMLTTTPKARSSLPPTMSSRPKLSTNPMRMAVEDSEDFVITNGRDDDSTRKQPMQMRHDLPSSIHFELTTTSAPLPYNSRRRLVETHETPAPAPVTPTTNQPPHGVMRSTEPIQVSRSQRHHLTTKHNPNGIADFSNDNDEDATSIRVSNRWPLIGIPLMFVAIVSAVLILWLTWNHSQVWFDGQRTALDRFMRRTTASSATAANPPTVVDNNGENNNNRAKCVSLIASGNGNSTSRISIATRPGHQNAKLPACSTNQQTIWQPQVQQHQQQDTFVNCNLNQSLLSRSPDFVVSGRAASDTTTRTTSAASSSGTLTSERYCKNSELLCTEHVLINSNNRPTDVMRFGNESFA